MLKIEKVSKKIGQNTILSDINFSLGRKEILGILGPSGSGKTTLLRIIAGLEEPTVGQIWLQDKLVSSPKVMVQTQKRNIGLVFQDLALWPHMNVYRHLEFVLGDKGFDKERMKEKMQEVLRQARFPAEKISSYPHQLSGGEKQRLALARCLAQGPLLLLMDEPLSNLDELLKLEIIQELKNIHSSTGISIIYVSHNIDEIAQIAEKIIVLEKGETVYQGLKEDIPGTDNLFLDLVKKSMRRFSSANHS